MSWIIKIDRKCSNTSIATQFCVDPDIIDLYELSSRENLILSCKGNASSCGYKICVNPHINDLYELAVERIWFSLAKDLHHHVLKLHTNLGHDLPCPMLITYIDAFFCHFPLPSTCRPPYLHTLQTITCMLSPWCWYPIELNFACSTSLYQSIDCIKIHSFFCHFSMAIHQPTACKPHVHIPYKLLHACWPVLTPWCS